MLAVADSDFEQVIVFAGDVGTLQYFGPHLLSDFEFGNGRWVMALLRCVHYSLLGIA
jgi:hypothetical protein